MAIVSASGQQLPQMKLWGTRGGIDSQRSREELEKSPDIDIGLAGRYAAECVRRCILRIEMRCTNAVLFESGVKRLWFDQRAEFSLNSADLSSGI